MRRPRYHFAETTHNQDRWLLTYADMITLLTAFFLMLYSMSVMSKGKFSQLAISVRTSFSGSPSGGDRALPDARASVNQLGLSAYEYRNYTRAMQNLTQYVEQSRLTGSVSTRSDERGLVISLVADNMVFDRGKADIRAAGAPILQQVAQVLKSTPNRVAIEGHTCDLPIHTPQFPSNWELSSARAGTLLRYFTGEIGLPPDRFMAAGYADTRPLVRNDSETNRARNRRVDIVILKTEARREADLALHAEVRRITVDGAGEAPDANQPQ
jgi:chemotaxis protein MotB